MVSTPVTSYEYVTQVHERWEPVHAPRADMASNELASGFASLISFVIVRLSAA